MAANLVPITSDGGFTSGGNINLDGNLNLNGGNIIQSNDDDLLITTKDGDGIVSSSVLMSPGDTLTRLEQWSGQDSMSFTTADWATGVYTTQGGGSIGAVEFTGAANIIDFVDSLVGIGHIYFSVNGGPQLVWDGSSAGGTNITFLTPTLPETDPTTVTSFEYYYSYKSGFEIDYDSNEVNLYANDTDINLETTSNRDINLTSSGDVSLTANSASTWTFDTTGDLTLPSGGNLVVSGSIVSSGASPAPRLSGFSSVSALRFTNNNANVTVQTDPGIPSGIAAFFGSGGDWTGQPTTNLSATGGSGSGLTVDVTVSGGAATGVAIATPGTGYTNGDILTVNSGGASATFSISVQAALNWTFDTTGTLVFPRDTDPNTADPILTIVGGANPTILSTDASLAGPANLGISALNTIFTGFSGDAIKIYPDDGEIGSTGNLQLWTNSGGNTEYSWTFDNTGNLTIPSVSGGLIKTVANASIGIVAVDNGTNNPAQLLSMTNAGAATSIVSAYATNATIQTNATGTINTWAFDSTGNLTLPGNAVAINFANGSSAFGNIATINLNGNTSQVLLGNGAFAAIPSSSIIANGNSNVSIATANGNVIINAVGNTTMTVTGTGANVTGTLTSTGKIGYASGSTVTQTTNRGNGVTINALAGTIITTSAAMVANQIDTFSVANDQVDPNNDIVLVQIVSPNFGVYNCIAQPSATISVSLTGFYVNIVNISGFTTTSDAITIRFMVIKAPNA